MERSISSLHKSRQTLTQHVETVIGFVRCGDELTEEGLANIIDSVKCIRMMDKTLAKLVGRVSEVVCYVNGDKERPKKPTRVTPYSAEENDAYLGQFDDDRDENGYRYPIGTKIPKKMDL